MAFKNNLREPFLNSIDPFGGRGIKTQGLNHGGQYSVDYIVDGLKQTQRRGAKSPTQGQTPYLRNSPPVASPRPTNAEEKKMKNVVGVDDVSTDNENFVNVSGNKKKEIERGLADYTCWRVWDGGGQNCSDHARFALQNGRCNAGVIATARQRLDACTRAQGNPDDVAKCSAGRVNYSDNAFSDRKGRREHVQKTARNWLNELDSEIDKCLLSRQQGGQGGSSGGGQNDSGYQTDCPSGTVYGCTDDTAINFDRCATVDNGSCSFGEESTDVDGTFGIDTTEIQNQIDALFSAVKDLTVNQQAPRQSDVLMPEDYGQVQTASVGGKINPVIVGGIVLVVGLAIFLMNQKKPTMIAPPPRPIQ